MTPGPAAGQTLMHIQLPIAMRGALRRAAVAEGAANVADAVREALAEWIIASDPDFPVADRVINREGHWIHKGMSDGDLPT